tara:strand:+ start:34 stop:468 length:435 start_codon:yes stop_codon:yes gene_type:complete
MIECSFREFHEFGSVIASSSNKRRKGFYSHSVIPVSGLGRDKWLIIVHIDINYQKHLHKGLSEKQIFQRCIEFLNQPPPRKKYAKKKPKPLYGHLTPYKAKFKEDENGQFIEAEIMTDQRKNKNFWREGIKYRKYRMPSKLKSK